MKILNTINSTVNNISGLIPDWAVSLSMRFAVFYVFWKSAQTKISGMEIFGQQFAFWNVTDSTVMLFEYEYALPLIPPEIAAYLATFGEFFLSLGVLLGLLTRISAFGLLIMTAVIQFFVYPESWGVHLLWAAILLSLIKQGPGAVSLDYAARRS